jgi:hypothetical protein
MEINYSKNLLNTDDLDVRLDELEESLEGFNAEELKDAEEDVFELKELKGVRDQLGSEWFEGIHLIKESDWVNYVREQEEHIVNSLPSYVIIDWEETAKNVSTEYSTVELMGETFYYQ